MPRRDGQGAPVPCQGEAAQRGPGPGRRDRRARGREVMINPPDQGKDCVLAWGAMPHALQGHLTRQQADWLDPHRTAARRVGTAGVSTWKSRWLPKTTKT